LVRAARHIFKLGPKALVIKRGEYGGCWFIRIAPSVSRRSRSNKCTTHGRGDTFAGGFMGISQRQSHERR